MAQKERGGRDVRAPVSLIAMQQYEGIGTLTTPRELDTHPDQLHDECAGFLWTILEVHCCNQVKYSFSFAADSSKQRIPKDEKPWTRFRDTWYLVF